MGDAVAASSGGLLATGLSSADAAARLALDGPNELPRPPAPRLWRRVARELRDPLTLLLLIAAAASVVVVRDTDEAAAIAAIVVINVTVATLQQSRADRALAELHEMTAPTASVHRDGKVVTLPAAGVVVGDIVELAAGDRIPADVRLIWTASMAVDESLLTGESLPVDKSVPPSEDGEPSSLTGLAGTSVVRGRATGEVTATGAATALGRVASAMTEPPPPPLQRELRRLGKTLAAVAVLVGVLLVHTCRE